MRLPEKPPSDEETHKLLSEQKDTKAIEDLKPYLAIVNSEYLHWDEIPMRFKDINFDLKMLWGYARLIRGIHSPT